jgi:3-oxoacyl-[acyl-carrier protein] reductase
LFSGFRSLNYSKFGITEESNVSLLGKNILVVGAATSIGQTIIDCFLSRGANVLATVHKHRPKSLDKAGITVAELDLLDFASLEQFSYSVASAFGSIDVVIFLSGVLPGKSLVAYDNTLMHQVMMVNFTGQAALMRHLIPYLADGALVLMVSSISAERGSFDPIYAAAKAAQIAFVKSLATWLSPKIRFNAVAPGLIENSTMFDEMAPERRSHHLRQTPTGRLTTNDDIAGVIINLCEPAWSNVNGQVIRINGGAFV